MDSTTMRVEVVSTHDMLGGGSTDTGGGGSQSGWWRSEAAIWMLQASFHGINWLPFLFIYFYLYVLISY